MRAPAVGRVAAVVFDVPGMTASQYDAVMAGLDQRGLAVPDGRLAHVASPQPGGWLVVDVWASEEHLERFAPVLMTLIAEAGVTPPVPRVAPTHRIER